MSIEEKAQEARQIIQAQLADLDSILSRAHREQDYDGGFQRLDRWKFRIVRLLHDHVSPHEADKFKQMVRVRVLTTDPFTTLDDEVSEYRGFLVSLVEELEKYPKHSLTATAEEAETPDIGLSQGIFIVHGHDEAMKQTVARTLEKLGLEAVILHEKPNEGRTIIEKFMDYSGVSFAVVLLSPDDLGFHKHQEPKNAKLRARQNVIFELGFFIGKIGRDRVLVLYQQKENFEMPSDYSGVLYTPYDNAGRWQYNLVKELKACGYDVDANKLI